MPAEKFPGKKGQPAPCGCKPAKGRSAWGMEWSNDVLEGSAFARPNANGAAPQKNGVRALFAGIAVIGLLAWSYSRTFAELAHRWQHEADYSHGFLVPFFSLFLLWHRRDMLQALRTGGSWWGLPFLILAGVLRWLSVYFFYPLLDAPSLVPCLSGVALLAGGWGALRWAGPAIVYLFFMVPLPATIAGLLSQPLQSVGTQASTWLLQTAGIPAVARGNVIWLTEGQIGVVEACSGLRMLMLFLAMTVGAALIIQRPLWEKAFVALSALALGVLTNVLRIALAGVLFEKVGAEFATRVYHDLAGWLMMPSALCLLGLELHLLSKLLVVPARRDPVLVHR
jgi:exosortase